MEASSPVVSAADLPDDTLVQLVRAMHELRETFRNVDTRLSRLEGQTQPVPVSSENDPEQASSAEDLKLAQISRTRPD